MSRDERNCRLAGEVLIHGACFDAVRQRYGVSLSTLRAVLIFHAHRALGVDLDSLAAIRRGVRQRLVTECLLMVDNTETVK